MAEEESKLEFSKEVTIWSQKTAKKMVDFIYSHGIDHTGALARSIEQNVMANGGNVDKVIFKFLRYGRFRDMGVGRGFARGGRGTDAFNRSRNENGSLKQVNRTPAPWYSKTMYGRIKFLSERLLVDMSFQAMDTLKARLRRINNHSSNTTS